MLGWLTGQKSPIHNHRGSQCCVRVLQGTAVETVYSRTRDGFFETHTDRYAASSVFGGQDTDIHTLENDAAYEQGLVTLHLYRPALTRMELFDVKKRTARRSRAGRNATLLVVVIPPLPTSCQYLLVARRNRMNASLQTSVFCPRCQCDSEIVVLGRGRDSILIECHACLTIQVVQNSQGQSAIFNRAAAITASNVFRDIPIAAATLLTRPQPKSKDSEAAH